MQRLIWSPASRDDLRRIDAWLGARNPVAAAQILRSIRAAALRLTDYPRIGRALEEPFRVLGIRHTPYVMVYRLHDDRVEIVRIRHARENWLPVEGDI